MINKEVFSNKGLQEMITNKCLYEFWLENGY